MSLGTAAMNLERGVLQIVRTADVGQRAASGLGRRQARDEDHHVDVAPSHRNLFDHLLIEHALLRGPLDVNDRLSPVTVIVSSRAPTRRSASTVATKCAGQFDPFTPHDRESAQRECHHVGAWPQIDDAVLTASVGDNGANFSINASLEASTVTPGKTAPEGSRTTPVIDACACANAGTGPSTRRRTTSHVSIATSAASSPTVCTDSIARSRSSRPGARARFLCACYGCARGVLAAAAASAATYMPRLETPASLLCPDVYVVVVTTIVLEKCAAGHSFGREAKCHTGCSEALHAIRSRDVCVIEQAEVGSGQPPNGNGVVNRDGRRLPAR